MLNKNRCIIILSEKSSGSSALQNILTKHHKIKNVVKTRHFENETLYWTKAASILNMPQLNVEGSEVPFKPATAKKELITFLKENLGDFQQPNDDEALIMNGWRKLCEIYSPVFLEKSPHHLYQWSAIKLILKCINALDNIEFLVIGLVRNPIDTIYSQFRRWKADPGTLQNRWFVSYQNLLKLKDILNEKLIIVRYEDLVSSTICLAPVYHFCEIKNVMYDADYFHNKSIQKWRSDPYFNLKLSNDIIKLAEKYGYNQSELEIRRKLLISIILKSKLRLVRILKILKKYMNFNNFFL